MAGPPSHERGLIVRCLKGDQAAFRSLFDLYFDELYRTALLLMKSPHDADDVVQEAFIRAFQALGRYDLDRPFRPWVHRILLNVCKDQWKRRRWRLTPLDQVYDLTDIDGKGPETELLRSEEQASLAEAIQSLSPKHRIVVVLHFLNSMRVSEVAEAVGIPEGTVKSRLYHAVRMLRKRLERSDGSVSDLWVDRGEEAQA